MYLVDDPNCDLQALKSDMVVIYLSDKSAPDIVTSTATLEQQNINSLLLNIALKKLI